jgi:hypothetical protein
MTDKYYTPDITEFKVGFKYERLVSKKCGTKVPIEEHHEIWEKQIATKDNLITDYSYWPSPIIRVKYLDKDDIEELGWELITKQIKDYSHWCFFKFNQVELHVQLNNKYFPRKLNINDKHHQIGNLHIDCKNYNELQTIMKQLNIQKND